VLAPPDGAVRGHPPAPAARCLRLVDRSSPASAGCAPSRRTPSPTHGSSWTACSPPLRSRADADLSVPLQLPHSVALRSSGRHRPTAASHPGAPAARS
jgi:hypothetical protein